VEGHRQDRPHSLQDAPWPSLTSNILDASLHTAARIGEYIFDRGLAGGPRPADIDAHIHAWAYEPVYPA
jgi:hypothetical protein